MASQPDYIDQQDTQNADHMRGASQTMLKMLWQHHRPIMESLRASRPNSGEFAQPEAANEGEFKPGPKPLWPRWYQPPLNRRPSGKDLVRKVAAMTGVTLDELRGTNRTTRYIHARSICTKLLRERGLSFPQIGNLLGGRDHSTMIHAYNKFDLYARNGTVREVYTMLAADEASHD